MNKVVSLEQLPNLIGQLSGHHIVLVGGVFDIFHIGHLRFLTQAKQQGDILIVLVESDKRVKELKGELRPIHTQAERLEVLEQMSFIDYLVPLSYVKSDQDYFAITQTVHPAIIAVTEGDPQLPNKQKQAESVGARIVIIPQIKTPSTTQLARLLELEP